MSRNLAKSLLTAIVSLVLAMPLAAECGDWQWQNPTPQGNRLSGVAAGRGMFVAVGAAGTVLTSPDGASWTARVANTSADLESVAWNGTLFAAVGAGGTALTSADGTSWTSHAVGTAATPARSPRARTAPSGRRTPREPRRRSTTSRGTAAASSPWERARCF